MGKATCVVPECPRQCSSFVLVPVKEKDVFDQWIKRINSPKLLVKSCEEIKKTYVCLDNFAECCKTNGGKHRLLYRSLPTLLLPDFAEAPTLENSFLPPAEVRGYGTPEKIKGLIGELPARAGPWDDCDSSPECEVNIPDRASLRTYKSCNRRLIEEDGDKNKRLCSSSDVEPSFPSAGGSSELVSPTRSPPSQHVILRKTVIGLLNKFISSV